MGKVSQHFNRNEFACGCGCKFQAADVELLEILEKVREHFGKPIIVTSGCRCLKHNHEIGSKDTSQHVRGMAVDFKIKGISPQLIYDYIDSWHDRGLGIYDTFIHVDVKQTKKRRWDNRT